MPATSHERALINANSARVYREISDAAACEGVTSEEMNVGMRRVERMRFDEMSAVASPPARSCDPVERARERFNWSQGPVGVSAPTRF
jgi:hypothetical protein